MELALSSNITLKFGRIVPDNGYILLNDTAHAAIGLMSEFPAIGLVSEGTNGLKPIVKDCHELQADIVTVVDFDRTVSR